ncbi:MAG: hypothetical protein HRU15_05730 [Planctomycetes bacterium]|nr:hypothetical protein [Planctomycetota bacterium]
MAEVYENEFIATTAYTTAQHPSGYYVPGEWAAGLRIAKAEGQSENGKYSVYIHDNVFKSNDKFVLASKVSQNIRIEKNTFIHFKKRTKNSTVVQGAGSAEITRILKAGGNKFKKE